MSPPPSVKPFGVVSAPPLLAELSTSLADLPPLSLLLLELLLLLLLLLLLVLLALLLLLLDSVARNRMRAACGRATREQLRSIAIVDVASSSSRPRAPTKLRCAPDCAQI